VSCREIAGLLGAWLDDEMDLVRSAELEAHVGECAVCSAQRRRLEALRAALREHAPYYTAPAHLRRRVAIRKGVPWWLVVAAAAACVLAGLVLWLPAAHGDAGQEIVQAHVRSLLANHLLDVASSDQHTVKPWFAGKLDFAPKVEDLSATGFPLEGGRLDYLDHRVVAALVYRRRQHTINVFVWPAAGRDSAARGGVIQGYNVLHWTRGGMAWWAVSDVNADDLRQLAEALVAPAVVPPAQQ